jgi:hypothetical protein
MSNQFLDKWITVLGINPEPWAVGTAFATRSKAGVHAGVSPNTKLVAYQNALKEELRARNFEPIENQTVRLTLQMLFVRQVDSYTVRGKTKTGNYADATNLGKGTEDAMQGILFPNDRQMAWTHPIVVDQGLQAEPFIAFKIGVYESNAQWTDFVNLLRIKQTVIDRTSAGTDDASW